MYEYMRVDKESNFFTTGAARFEQIPLSGRIIICTPPADERAYCLIKKRNEFTVGVVQNELSHTFAALILGQVKNTYVKPPWLFIYACGSFVEIEKDYLFRWGTLV